MAKNFISGLYGTEFYKILQQGLLKRGYRDLESFISEAPNYWFDEEAWKRIYSLAPFENPSRVFEQRIGTETVPIMAAYVTDEGEGPLLHSKGATQMTGEIPRMARGLAFDVDSYEKMAALSRQGVDVNDAYFDAFTKDTLNLVQSIHAQRSFTGLQVESLGKYTTAKNTSSGITSFEIDLHPLSANRKKCGGFQTAGSTQGKKYAWSNSSASPLGDLMDMFYYGWYNNKISPIPTDNVFRISSTAWGTLKNHADTKTRVALWKYGPAASTDLGGYTVSDTDLKQWFVENGLPPIEVEAFYGTQSLIHPTKKEIREVATEAFDSKTVVLRPAGKFGEFQWKRASNLLATSDTEIFYADGGSMAIAQDRGKKGLVFQIESICVPVPYAINKVLYLSIDQAES